MMTWWWRDKWSQVVCLLWITVQVNTNSLYKQRANLLKKEMQLEWLISSFFQVNLVKISAIAAEIALTAKNRQKKPWLKLSYNIWDIAFWVMLIRVDWLRIYFVSVSFSALNEKLMTLKVEKKTCTSW